MPKTAIDPFFATNIDPVTAGRRAIVATASPNDLPHVTSSLIVSVTTASSVSFILADDPDTGAVTLSLPVGVWQLNLQVRAVTALPTGSVLAVYCN